MYTVIRVERSEGIPDCARVLSTHRSLEEAERVKHKVQTLLERSHRSGEVATRQSDIRILWTAGQQQLGREIAARQLKRLPVVSTESLPA